MAFNEILVGRINRFAQKLLVIKNTALRGLSPDLQMVLPLEDGVSTRYLQGWQRFMQVFSVAAGGAGTTAQGRLRNPPGSNVIGVVEYISFNMQLTDQPQVIIGAATADLGSVANLQNRMDPRGNPKPSLIMSTGAPAASLPSGGVISVTGPATSTVIIIQTENQEIPILPGDALSFGSNVLNQAMSCSLMWRERVLESSELT